MHCAFGTPRSARVVVRRGLASTTIHFGRGVARRVPLTIYHIFAAGVPLFKETNGGKKLGPVLGIVVGIALTIAG